MKLYIDSNLVQSSYNIQPYNNSQLPIYFGSWPYNINAHYFNGKMDNISIWSRALSHQEIKQYVLCPPTGEESDLLGFWNFESGSQPIANDISTSSGSFNGTIIGASFNNDVPNLLCQESINSNSITVSTSGWNYVT